MMEGGAFILLKAGGRWPETAKQAEIRLADFQRILRISYFGGQSPSPSTERRCDGCTATISAGYG
jgi:hypothetical protein